MGTWARVALLSGLAQAFAGTSGAAATFSVDTFADAPDAVPGDLVCLSLSGGCTLRAAVQEANALAGFDRIDIPSGPYFLNLQDGVIDDTAISGDIDILEPVHLNGLPGAQWAQIGDGFVLHTPLGERIFDVQTGDSTTPVIFERVLLSFGKAHDALGGGAALVRAGSFARFERSILYANGADARGNALAVYGRAELWRSHVFDNHRAWDAVPGEGGGGIYVGAGASLLFELSGMDSNNHCRGGGILADGPSAVVIRASTLYASQASNLGGCQDPDSHGDLIAARGAVTVDILNSTLSDSIEAIHAIGGAQIALRHVTLANANNLHGHFALEGPGNQLTIANSVVSRRADGDSCSAPTSAIASLGGNVFQHGTPCGIAAQASDQTVTGALGLMPQILEDPGNGISVEARLVLIPTITSPIIDAGINSACAPDDEAGNPRPQPGPAAVPGEPARCDAGAIEWPMSQLHADGFE